MPTSGPDRRMGAVGDDGDDVLEQGRPDWHPRRRRLLRWTAGLAVLAVAVVSVGLTFAQSNDGQGDLPPNQVVATDLRLGDCVHVPLGLDEVPPVVDRSRCNTAHNAEVFWVGALPEGSYPGSATLQRQVDQLCLLQVEPFLGGDPGSLPLKLLDFPPTAISWDQGQRGYECLLADPAGDLTSTLKGAVTGGIGSTV